MRCNLHHIAESQNQSSIRTLLEDVAAKALDATSCPTASIEDSLAIAHHPCYERHVVQEYADGGYDTEHWALGWLLTHILQLTLINSASKYLSRT